ncbi:hypothetical protein pb186bvf_002974 [Paramecium bursaria]
MNKIIKPLFRFSAGHVRPKGPIYAPSIQERLIYLNLYRDGVFDRIPAFVGESLLEALKRFTVDEVVGSCDGGEKLDSILEDPIQPNSYGPLCSDCQVYIASPWVERLRPRDYREELQLDNAVQVSEKHSRLSCTIKIEKWMDEMEVSTALNNSNDY